MNRILLASDLTDRSRRAGDRARLLQRRFGAHLTALHVIEADLPDAIRRQRVHDADAGLRAALGLDGADAETAAVTLEVIPGVDHKVIVDRGRQHDLIVLGMHRASLLDEFIGTTAERVLRATARPVLMVTDAAMVAYRRVLIAVDLYPSSRRAAAAAAWLAGDAQFFMVNAHDVPFSGYMTDTAKQTAAYDPDIYAAMDEIAAELPRRPDERLIRMGEPAPTIRAACAEVSADLVVLATRARQGLTRAFLGSVAEQVLADPPCDVLVVRGG
jgi:nucleotide-binding universal stress UspA family protein